MKEVRELFEIEEKSLTLQEVEERLGLKDANDFKKLVRAINELVEEGYLIQVEDRFEKAVCAGRKCGVVTIKRNHFAYITVDGENLEVINAHKMHVLNGDEVLYEVCGRQVKVLQILKHHIVYVVGIVRIRNRRLSFFPDDDHFPKDFTVTNFKQFRLDDRVKVRCYISDYEKRELKIESVIGYAHDSEVQELSILYSYDVPLSFSKTTENEANTFSKNIKVEDYPTRRDLTKELVITIDGDDAKDFDDAIFLKKEGNHYLLKVHIADVSHYVTLNSSLDKDAYKRGTSIYYPGHVIPMLPFALSNEVCSLKPNENRLAMTVEMEYDQNANVVRYDLYESVIASKYRMTYSNVNRILEGDPVLSEKYAQLLEMLKDAKELSDRIKERRKESGGIDFGQEESEIVLKNGKVVDVRPRARGVAEGIIEDFMIAANVCVAEHMRYLEYPMIYRNHDYPKEDRLDAFLNFVGKLGYSFKGSKHAIHAKQLSDCLDSFEGTLEYPVVSNFLLRSMAKARYENVASGHYGLGLENYCHFTSPIRRYPDLVVHRMLKKYVFAIPDISAFKEEEKRNGKIAVHASEREKTATYIERDILDLKKCEYMKHHIGEVYEAVISSVTSFGFYVKLANTIEGLVHIKNLDGFFTPLEDGSLSNGEKRYQVGDIVKVKCVDVDLRRSNIDFVLYKKKKPQQWI